MKNDNQYLEIVKTHAKALAEFTPILTEYSPMIISHPFTKCGILPYSANLSSGEYEYLDITTSQENLNRWQALVKEQIDKSKNISQVYSLIDANFKIFFVECIQNSVSNEIFSTLLADAYTNTEYPNSNPNVSKASMLKMFKNANKKILMSEDEFNFYSNFDNEIKIYRGVSSTNKKHINGMSWTLSKQVARKFADRYFSKGYVFEAEVDKKDILAFFSSMNETEIVVDPKTLKNIKPLNCDSEQEKE